MALEVHAICKNDRDYCTCEKKKNHCAVFRQQYIEGFCLDIDVLPIFMSDEQFFQNYEI